MRLGMAQSWPENREDTWSDTSRTVVLMMISMISHSIMWVPYVSLCSFHGMFEEVQDTSIDVGP